MNSLPTPVSLERIRALLTVQQLDYGSQGADAWSVPTRNALVLWSLENPQVLQIRGQWRGEAETPEQFQGLRTVISRCNSTRVSPKAYLLPLTDGHRFGLMTECNILINRGLTEEQFFGFCEASFTAIMSFFQEVEAALPDLVTWEDSR